MSIEAEGSRGVYAECPACHKSINHGFQVCQHCGYVVSAHEQQGLQKILAKNVTSFVILAVVIVVIGLGAYHYLF